MCRSLHEKISKEINKYFDATSFGDVGDSETTALIDNQKVLTPEDIENMTKLFQNLKKIGIEVIGLEINPPEIWIETRIYEKNDEVKVKKVIHNLVFRLRWKGGTVEEHYLSFLP